MYMPDFLIRVGKFAARPGSDDTPSDLANAIAADFTAPMPIWLKAAFTTDDDDMVGHILAMADGPMLRVWQMEFDQPLPARDRAEFFRIHTEWAKARGCTQSEAWVENQAQARRLQIFYGYKQDKIRLRRAL